MSSKEVWGPEETTRLTSNQLSAAVRALAKLSAGIHTFWPEGTDTAGRTAMEGEASASMRCTVAARRKGCCGLLARQQPENSTCQGPGPV
mmetsp:Transcript_14598/g.31202  ORF Transcript_14598/g.31202 Transcript_14598/m.31202 type:complete len:90 (+) Transcript_14598:383-652(+)